VLDILKNWPKKDVEVIVIIDGECILKLADLKVQASLLVSLFHPKFFLYALHFSLSYIRVVFHH
jgi:hypothetical protein